MVLGTFGLSIIVVPLLYIAAVAASAYAAEDRHGRHHYLHPWTPVAADPEGKPESV